MSQDLETLANDRTEQEKKIADQEKTLDEEKQNSTEQEKKIADQKMALDEEKEKQKIARKGQQAEQPNEPTQARELHREG